MAYLGVSPSNGVRKVHTYTATASQTTFSGAGAENISLSYRDSTYIDVYQNGVKLGDADYTATSGTSVVLGTGATASDLVVIVVYDVFSVADTVSKTDGGQFDGAVTLAGGVSGNTTFSGEIITSTSGTSNVRIGENAGDAIASGGNYNVVVGDEAGTALTTGDNNVAIGFEALNTEDANGLNVAVGFRSLKNLNAGADAENTAVGNNTGLSMTTAVYNTVVGSQAGDALTDGSANTAVGYNTLSADTRGQNSTAVGRNALLAQNFTSSTDSYNVAMGRDAGLAITTGVQNTFIGSLAGDAQTVADNNTAVGFEALSTNTNGSACVAIGFRALKTQNYGSATDSLNVAVGNASGTAVTTGTKNTLIGHATGENQTDAGNNTFIGHKAGNAELRGHNSVAVGSNALLAQNTNSNTSIDNTAVGYNVGKAVTTGVKNTLIGSGTGDGITTGDRNTAVGYFALGGAVDDGQYNTCIGADAGLVTTGDQNTFVGAYDPSTGGSGAEITSGSKNTILGSYNGNQDSLDIRTGSNNVVLSDGDGTVAAYRTGSSGARSWYLIGDADSNVGLFVRNQTSSNPYGMAIQFPNEANNTTSQYFIVCTDSSASRFLVYANGNVVNQNNSYGAISDVKLKEQIADASSQWDDIKALKIRKYKMKEEVSAKGDSDDLWRLGVVAQELETAKMNGLVTESPDRDEDMKDLGTTTKSVKYSVLYMKAVKALQEAMARIETLETKVKALEG